MAEFIAKMIKKAGQTGEQEGQAKYRAYFADTRLYLKYQGSVDAILKRDGCENLIVS